MPRPNPTGRKTTLRTPLEGDLSDRVAYWSGRCDRAEAEAERLRKALWIIAMVEPVTPVNATGASREAANRLRGVVKKARMVLDEEPER